MKRNLRYTSALSVAPQLLAEISRLEEQMDRDHTESERLKVETQAIKAHTAATLAQLQEQINPLSKADRAPVMPASSVVRGNIYMRCITLLLLCSFLLGCRQGVPVIPQQSLQRAMNELNTAKTPEERFYALNDAAKESFVAGKVGDAQKYAKELMTLLPQFQGNWNYGNAVHDANLVLGRIAVREGRIDDAKRYLLAAGKSPGSATLDSFGPNMSLAKDLLEKGERQVVLEYFELCRKFWELHEARLNAWSQQVKDGKTPDFGANLIY